jgi:hypothetical protein
LMGGYSIRTHRLHSLYPFDEFFISDTVHYRAKATIE